MVHVSNQWECGTITSKYLNSQKTLKCSKYLRMRDERFPHSHHRISTGNMSSCRFSLGNHRYVEIKEWKEEMRVNFGEWKDDKLRKKGINLILMQ